MEPANKLQPGKEQHETFTSSISKRTLIEYNYRAINGMLFTCVAKTLKAARDRRDTWLAKYGMSE